jgi:hypothetical protein
MNLKYRGLRALAIVGVATAAPLVAALPAHAADRHLDGASTAMKPPWEAVTDLPPGPSATEWPPGPGAPEFPPGPSAADFPPGPGAAEFPPGPSAADFPPGPGIIAI